LKGVDELSLIQRTNFKLLDGKQDDKEMGILQICSVSPVELQTTSRDSIPATKKPVQNGLFLCLIFEHLALD